MEIELFISSGNLIGECWECKEPTTGSFDADENRIEIDGREEYLIELKCVGCGEIQKWYVDPEIFAEPC